MSRPAPGRALTVVDLRRCLWAEALTLPGQTDLRTSLIAELAEYLHQPAEQVAARCTSAASELAQTWQAAAPATPAAATAFYRETDAYLYDLTWWHALAEDDSALVQVQALETARARAAATALDFGSGIGALGLLLARHDLAVTLADVNPQLNAYARWRFERRGLAARVLDLNAESLPAGAFDFVAAVDVLEHLPDPLPAVEALAAALRPGGTLFVHLPAEHDGQRPQHVAHDSGALAARLAAAGVWLAQVRGPVLVFRRGPGPSYSAALGWQVMADEAGPLLVSRRPLRMLRLNPQAAAVLGHLNGGHGLAELATATHLTPARLVAFLDDLAGRRLVVRRPAAPAVWPPVSVVVPARNRPDQTRACVESLLKLDYPAERLEIIVVDDASEPPLANVLAGLPVRLVRLSDNLGQSSARNLAAAQARGDLLAFVDNDCLAEPQWLRALVPYLDDPAIAIVGGRVVAPPASGTVAAFEAARSPLDMGAYAGEVAANSVVAYLPTCNLIVRREVFQAVGGFDAQMALGEDVDFIWRVRQAGWRAWYAPEGRVLHHHRARLGALLARRADYGSSEADLQRRHPYSRRVIVMPMAVVALLAALAAGVTWAPVGLALAVAAVVILAGDFIARRRKLAQARARVPLAQVAGAVLREHGALAYHFGSNVMRYYSAPLLAAGLMWRPLLLPLAALLLITSVTNYRQLRPRLAWLTFVGLSALEMLAYQAGVWRGCAKWRTVAPMHPRIRLLW